MFRVMRKLTEMRSVDRIGGTAGFGGKEIQLNKLKHYPIFA